MKKMIALLAVLVLTFALVAPAAAAGNGPGGGNGGNGSGSGTGTGPLQIHTETQTQMQAQTQMAGRGIFALTGTIATLGTNTVTIDVLHGNKLAQPTIGTQVTVTVTPQTRYLYKDGTTITTIGLADLLVGQNVSVNGLLANNVWTALRITVGADLACLP
jgi:hypothetical protein